MRPAQDGERPSHIEPKINGSGDQGWLPVVASVVAAPLSWSLRFVIQPDGRPDWSVAVQAESVMVTGPCAVQSRSGMEAPMGASRCRLKRGW